MTTRKRNLTHSMTDLREMLEALRAYGVSRYKLGELEVELAVEQPARDAEDFATAGLEDEDSRFDHVAMRPRREVTP